MGHAPPDARRSDWGNGGRRAAPGSGPSSSSPAGSRDARQPAPGRRRGRARLVRIFLCSALLLLLGAALAAGPAAGQTQVDGCQEINSSGAYEVTTDFSGSQSPCLPITASDVTIDGNGHTLSDADVDKNVGFESTGGESNVTIRNVTMDDWSTAVHVDGGSDVTVADARFRGGSLGVKAVNSREVALTNLTNANSGGLDLSNTSDLRIDGLTHDGVGSRLQLSGSNVTAANVTLESNSYGLYVGSDDATLRNVTVLSPGGSTHGIEVSGATGVVVEGATVSGSDQYAVYMSNSATAVEFHDSVLTDSTKAIQLASSVSNVTVSGTRMSGHSSSNEAVYLPGTEVTIRDSNVSSNVGTGIYVAGGGHNATLADTLVANNDAGGVVVGGADDARVWNNTVRDNGGVGVDKSGTSVQNLTIAANDVRSNAGNGIDVDGVDRGELDLSNNTVVGNDGDGAHVGSGDPGQTLAHNEFRSNAGNGATAQSHDTALIGNVLHNNTRGFDYDSDNATLRDNVVTNNSDVGIYLPDGMLQHSLDGTRLRHNGVGVRVGSPDDASNPALVARDVDVGASTRANTTLDFDATSVEVRSVSDPAGSPSGNLSIGRYVNATGLAADALFDFDLRYEQADVEDVDEYELATFRDDGTGWTHVDSSRLDYHENVVGANATSSFGTFGAFAPPPENITDCGVTISTDETTYALQDDVYGKGNPCVYVDASDVTIDGNGYGLRYQGSGSQGAAIQIDPQRRNHTIRNVTLDTWDWGLYLEESENVLVEDVTIRDSVRQGVRTLRGDGAVLRNVGVYGSGEAALRQNEGSYVVATGFDIGSSTAANTTLDFEARDVELTAVSDPPSAPGDQVGIGRYFDASPVNNDGTFFDADLHYEQGDVSNVHESSLSLWNYDSDAGEWTEVTGSTVDTSENVVSANVTSFSEFGAFGDASTQYFDVTLENTSSPAVEGGTLVVDATVENVGDESGSQTITLETGGTERDSETVTLGQNESTSLELRWSTSIGDAGDYTATVASENATDATGVTVQSLNELIWETDADWSDGATANRTVSDDVGDRENDTVRLGYAADDPDLVGYWPLDEDAGSTAYDASGTGNDAAHNGSPTVGQPGVLNTTGYEFDGSSDHLTVADDESLEFADTNTVAVSAWVRPANLTGDTRTAIVQKSDTSYNLQLLEDQPGFTIYDGDGWQTAAWNQTLQNDTWYHLAGTYDGSTVRLYVDGTLVDTTAASNLDDGGSFDLGIGENLDSTGRHFEGRMEEVRLYGANLSAAEAEALYETSRAGTHTTKWKSSSSTMEPADTRLFDVNATVGGGNLTAYVESDSTGDGTVDDVSDPIAVVDGQSDYAVSGLANGTNRVRLRLEFEAASLSQTPVASRMAVGEPANVTVSDVSTNSPIAEGENLTVTANVTNVGTELATQTVNLTVADAERDNETVSLNASESTTLTLNWSTTTGDAGDYTARVASEDDSDAAPASVVESSRLLSSCGTVDSSGTTYLDADIDATQAPCVSVQASDVTIEGQGHAIDGTNAPSGTGVLVSDAATLTNVTVANLTVRNWTDGLRVEDANQSTVAHVVAADGDRHGVHLRDVTNSTVRNATAVDNANVGVELNATEGVSVLDSEGRRNGWDGARFSHGAANSTVSNGTFANQTNMGVALIGAGEGNVVANSTIRDSGTDGSGDGVYLRDTRNATIRDNVLERPAFNGVGLIDDVDGAVVRGNDVSSPGLDGISVDGGGRVTVADTTVTDPGEHGVDHDGPANATLRNLTVRRAGVHGIRANGSATVELANGSIEDGAGTGLWLDNDSTIDASHSVVRGFAGGTLRLLNDSVATVRNLTIGASTATNTTIDATAQDVEVGPVSSPQPDPDGARSIARYVDATNTSAAGYLDVDLHYESADVAGLNESSLALWHYDTASAEWVELEGSSLDAGARTVSANVTSFSQFGAFATAPPEFGVSIEGTNSAVAEGDALQVDATVTNRGDEAGTQNVTLTIDGTQRDVRTVSLNGSENRSITLEWATESGDAGDYTAFVASEDDTNSTGVTVESGDDGGGGLLVPPDDDGGEGDDGPQFEVAIDETNEPVYPGDPLEVVATVTNVGSAEATDVVSLSVNETVRDEVSVTLAPNASTQVALGWAPGEGDVGDHRAVVTTSVDGDVQIVTVEPTPTLAVDVVGTSSPVSAGDALTVTAEVTASGDADGTVELVARGDRADARDVSLTAGESTTVSLTWGTRAGDAGSRTVTVRTPDDAESASVTVTAPANLGVSLVDPPDSVTVNETLVVEAQVTNRGDEAGSSRVVLRVGDEELASERVSLAGGASETVTLEWTPGPSDVGTREIAVYAGGGSASHSLAVEEDAGGVVPGFDPQWGEHTVDYEPTTQDTHVGGFLWLTALLVALGAFVMLSRRTLEGQLLGLTLLTAAARTGTDVLHASVGGIQTAQLLGLNTVLELYAGLLFLGFAATYGESDLASRRGAARLATVGLLGTAATATNSYHRLVFTNVRLAEGPFSYVAADTGPVGWLLLGVTLLSLAWSVLLLARSFLSGRDPAWRPVGVLASGVCLAVLVVALSVLDRGPLPGYDYTGAGVAAMLLASTTTLFGHGLHRVKQTAQKSLIEDLDDPIVIANDARVVVEYNEAAAELLAGIAEGERLEPLLGVGVEWPEGGETTSVERSRTELLPATVPEPAADGAGEHGVPGRDDGGDDGGRRSGTGERDAGAADDSRRDAGPDTGERDAGAADAGVGGPGERDPGAADADTRERDAGAAATGEPDTGAAGEDAVLDDRHFLVQTTPVTDDTGDSIGYTVRFTDVTELKRRRVELADKNAQLEQVASTISHDLRNPMTVAAGYVDQLHATSEGARAVEPDDFEEYLPHVRASLDRMDDIIADILALARSTEPVSARADVDFRSVAADAWATVDTGAASLHVASGGHLEADPGRLQRMLENLFRNAVEHVGPDVLVTVGLTDDGFYVEDDGPGIPPEERDAVFEQGYSGAVDGTGLGLSIVRQLARAHDWSIEIDPDADGARFVVTDAETDPDGGPGGDDGFVTKPPRPAGDEH